MAHLNGGRPEQAQAAARAALADFPHSAGLWQVLALAARNLDDAATAHDAFARAAALAPRDPKIAHGHARTSLEVGQPSTDLFRHAARLAPDDLSVVRGHAAALHEQGDVNGAAALIEQALSRRPDWIEGHALLSRLRWSTGSPDLGGSFRQALSRSPRDKALWYGWINLLISGERHEEALALAEEATRATGDRQAFLWHRTVCHSELGHRAEADAGFQALGRPTNIQTVVRVVRHLIRSGRLADAARVAELNRPADAGGELWPYLALTWRALGHPRWQWLEGDDRLVSVHDVGATLTSLPRLAEHLRKLHRATVQPLEQSLRGGTQTDGPLLSRMEPEIVELRARLTEAVAEHLAKLPPVDVTHPTLSLPRGRPVRFSGSWSVRLTDAGFHADHVHPAGWFSSAFYAALPEGGMGGQGEGQGRGRGEAGYLTLGENRDLLPELRAFRTVQPRPGRLVIFPSTMWHGTRPFRQGERLTAAFDIARPLS